MTLAEKIREDALSVAAAQVEIEKLKVEMISTFKKNERMADENEKWVRGAMQIMQQTLNDFTVIKKAVDPESAEIETQKNDKVAMKSIFVFCALSSVSTSILMAILFKLLL